METSSAAASSLTRHRTSLTAFVVAATVSLGICYLYSYYPDIPEPSPDRRLRRSNAVRHRRRHSGADQQAQRDDHSGAEGQLSTAQSDDDQYEDHDDEDHDGTDGHRTPGHRRQSSQASASTTSAEDSQVDENADLNTVRPSTVLGQHDAEHDHVTEHTMIEDEWYDDANEPPGQAQEPRAGQNIVSLLFRVSEDNARRTAYVHRGCQCNGCGMSPIRGIRYRCANCADFDFCETCESQGLHTKTHVFYKIRVPCPRLAMRQVQPLWYPGDPENCYKSLPRTAMVKFAKETGFERPELEALWEQWTFMAGSEWRDDPDGLGLAMDRRTFERYMVPAGCFRNMPPSLLHDRMFAFYDTNKDDLIGFGEFLHAVAYRRRKDALRKIFDGYDADEDGFVSRRDFLRLHRAYYVLFKQMHSDILESLDEQARVAAEARQLVTSRQPLSSMFGREGGFSHFDPDRPLEGKLVNSRGEVRITDGNNEVVKDDGLDTLDRQTILASLYKSQGGVVNLFIPVQSARDEYLNSLLYPPANIQHLQPIINGGHLGDSGGEDNDESETSEEEDAVPGNQAGPGEAAMGGALPASSASVQPRGSHPAYPQHPRVQYARTKVLERWRRRHFYVDEEEGATPPAGWDEDNDVSAYLASTVDSAKTTNPPPLSQRSRSSSKVRFAEDPEDYEVRSNPSTSSRSIPERWGGMDIPDAERDAGKEIYYQVISQAFNEILDALFTEKEDLAIQAAETKAERDKYRSRYANVKPDQLASLGSPKRPPSGLQSSEPSADGFSSDEAAAAAATDRSQTDQGSKAAAQGAAGQEAESASATSSGGPVPQVQAVVADAARDLTMPQFRPNTEADANSSNTVASAASEPGHGSGSPSADEHKEAANSPPMPSTSDIGDHRAAEAGNDKAPSTSPIFSEEKLLLWKRLDLAEEEAKTRGGWGRLNYEEFEKKYYQAGQKGTRLDYLSTWIDFCIP